MVYEVISPRGRGTGNIVGVHTESPQCIDSLDMLDFFRTTIEMMRKRLAKEPQQQFLRVVDRHRGFLAPCPKGKANGGMRTYGCRDCESFICSMTCVSGGSSGVYCAYPAQANTYGDWDTNYRV